MPDGFLVPPVLEYEPYSLASDEERKKAEHERSANANGTRFARISSFFSFEECSYFFVSLKNTRPPISLFVSLKNTTTREKRKKKKKKKTQNTPRDDDDDDARTEHEKNEHRPAGVAALVVEEEEIADACFVQAEENERTGRGDGHRNRKTSNKK